MAFSCAVISPNSCRSECQLAEEGRGEEQADGRGGQDVRDERRRRRESDKLKNTRDDRESIRVEKIYELDTRKSNNREIPFSTDRRSSCR